MTQWFANLNFMNETESQMRVRRAKDSIAYCQERETEARKALAMAAESTKCAREKYEELFIAQEKREVARRLLQV